MTTENHVIVVIVKEWDIRVYGPFTYTRAAAKANALEKKLKHYQSIGVFPLQGMSNAL